MRQLTLLKIFILTLMLSACSREQSALNDFQKSSATSELNQCIGVNGNITWKIFNNESVANPDVRIIEALMSKGEEHFTMQWYYNMNTKVSELAYAGKDGEKNSRLFMALDLSLFCMSKGNHKDTKKEAIPDKTLPDIAKTEIHEQSWQTESKSDKTFSTAARKSSITQTQSPPKDAAPEIKPCQNPIYPRISIQKEEEGTVTLKFLIDADGNVLQADVEKSSGYPRLDDAARNALSKCQFRPGIVDGKPEQSWASIKYTWRLE